MFRATSIQVEEEAEVASKSRKHKRKKSRKKPANAAEATGDSLQRPSLAGNSGMPDAAVQQPVNKAALSGGGAVQMSRLPF